MSLRKSSLITKLIILAVMLYAMITLVSLQPKISALQAEGRKLAAEADALQQENLEIQHNIDAMDSDEAVMKIARERLHLVADGELIFIDKSK